MNRLVSFTLKAFVCIVVVSFPRVFVPACFKKHASCSFVVFVVMTLVVCIYGVIIYFGFYSRCGFDEKLRLNIIENSVDAPPHFRSVIID